MRRAWILAIVLTGALAPAGIAQAKDFCLEFGAGPTGDVIVIKGFKPPKPGKCRPFKKGAYFNNGAFNGAIDGTACTNSTGDTMRVSWSLFDANNAYLGRFDIPYPALGAGTWSYVIVNSGVQSGLANAVVCASPSAPIP